MSKTYKTEGAMQNFIDGLGICEDVYRMQLMSPHKLSNELKVRVLKEYLWAAKNRQFFMSNKPRWLKVIYLLFISTTLARESKRSEQILKDIDAEKASVI